MRVGDDDPAIINFLRNSSLTVVDSEASSMCIIGSCSFSVSSSIKDVPCNGDRTYCTDIVPAPEYTFPAASITSILHG